MRLFQGKVGTRLTWAVAAGVVAALLPSTAAEAQRPRVEPTYILDDGGQGLDLRTVRRGFELFGGGDAAITGMRMTGNMGAGYTNYGDCDNNYSIYRCQSTRQLTNPVSGLSTAPFFEIEWTFAAPPNEYVKIRNVEPSVVNASGGGWTGGTSTRILGRPPRFGPADNTLGKLFAGVTSTTDGSCRDHQGFANGFWGAGYQLLPGSDCPDTWGSDGWQGAHPVDQAGFKELFDAQGDGFAWDYWRVPEDNQRLDKPFLGTRFTFYGETSDYSSDVLPLYGSVVPGGVGTPSIQGYPLGLRLHFEGFNFGVPTVNGAFFVQMLIINESDKVWGQGIDYDSIYFGMTTGTLFSTQNASRYALPEYGMTLYHNSNAQGAGGPCDDSGRRTALGFGCTGPTSSSRGYGRSALGIIFLRSPLGDLRNKLFTRTLAGSDCTVGSDPFCRPGHPNAGDTITFNRQGFGDYSRSYNYTYGTSAKATFGFHAASEELTNDGRDPAAQEARTLWGVFRSEDWNTRRDYYNKYVPPASPPWDYNKDGIPDTLALATCGRLGCAGVDSDTMPGGWLNHRGNIGGIQSFGPFALAAGDTTSLIYAIVGGGDSLEFWSQVKATIELYMNFYLAPDAPPPVDVVSTQVDAGTDQFGTANPRVNIYFSDAPERWVDPFLAKTADDIEAAPPTSLYGVLRAGNSWLVDSLRTLARNNLRRVEVYKSCDAGTSWTSDGDCDGDPTGIADTLTSGFGWRTYSVLDVDANSGDIPNVFSDGNVDGGRTYMYAFVGRSRGAKLLVDSAGTPVFYEFTPPIANALSRSTSDPNVASVYVPISRPAGYRAAAVDTTLLPPATVPFTLALSDNVETRSYRAVFGSEIVVARDSSISTSVAFRSIVTLQRRETVDASGVGVDSVIRRDAFVYDNPLEFLVTGTAVEDLGTATFGDTARTFTLYGRTDPDTGLAFVLVQSDGAPVFGSTALTANKSTPPALFGRSEFPGFTINADNSVRGNFDGNSESQYRGEQSRTELGLTARDTIVPRGIVNGSMVQWRQGSSTRAESGGAYEVSWTDDPFGTGRGFLVNKNNPAVTEAEVQAALNARAVAATGLTDQETADLVGVPQTDLVAVKLPFTITNTTFGRPVQVAMARRSSNRLVLGDAQDTISVEIPDDVWVPGDWLYFLEDLEEDSAVAGRLIMDTPTQPHRWTRRAMTFSRATLGCDSPRETCNPVPLATDGATGYLPMRSGDRTRFAYYAPFTATTEYGLTVNAAETGSAITAVTDSALSLIRVVPNPFVIFSQYQTSITNGLLAFTNLPSRGVLRIYTVNAQLVQQIEWEPADLEGDGDLFWDLRTREGIDVASGLYVWVVTAPTNPNDPGSATLHARGKFVVIRGDAQ